MCKKIRIYVNCDFGYNGRTAFYFYFFEGMQEHQPDKDMHGDWKDGGSVESSQSV